jgi:hypothetical protein
MHSRKFKGIDKSKGYGPFLNPLSAGTIQFRWGTTHPTSYHAFDSGEINNTRERDYI